MRRLLAVFAVAVGLWLLASPASASANTATFGEVAYDSIGRDVRVTVTSVGCDPAAPGCDRYGPWRTAIYRAPLEDRCAAREGRLVWAGEGVPALGDARTELAQFSLPRRVLKTRLCLYLARGGSVGNPEWDGDELGEPGELLDETVFRRHSDVVGIAEVRRLLPVWLREQRFATWPARRAARRARCVRFSQNTLAVCVLEWREGGRRARGTVRVGRGDGGALAFELVCLQRSVGRIHPATPCRAGELERASAAAAAYLLRALWRHAGVAS